MQHINSRPEEWRAIPGYEGLYEASDQGRVRSIDRINSRGHKIKGRMLKPSTKAKGYKQVVLHRDGKASTRTVHLIVLTTFVGPRPDGMEVCHNNGDSADNRLANLRFDNPSANQMDSVEHNTHHHARKTHCAKGHPFTPENTYQVTKGRACKTCINENNRRYRSTPEGKAKQKAYMKAWRARKKTENSERKA